MNDPTDPRDVIAEALYDEHGGMAGRPAWRDITDAVKAPWRRKGERVHNRYLDAVRAYEAAHVEDGDLVDHPEPVDWSTWDRRHAALQLAVDSHGSAAGADSDRCFTARASHFLDWMEGPVSNPRGRATESVMTDGRVR